MKTLLRMLLTAGLSSVALLSLLTLTPAAGAELRDGLQIDARDNHEGCRTEVNPHLIDDVMSQANGETKAILPATLDEDCIADLVITKAVVPNHLLLPGDALTYTLTYFNNGPGRADHVAVIDYLPAGIKRTDSSSNPDREPPMGAERVWIWNVGTLGAKEGGVITLGAIVDTNFAWGQLMTVTNWAAILATTRDIDLINNFDSATQRVAGCNLGAVHLTPAPDTVTPTGISLVSAMVTDCQDNPVSDGTLITFTTDSLGQFVTTQPRATSNGVATSTFQAGSMTGVSIVTGTTATALGTASITITTGAAYTLSLQADPLLQVVGGNSVLTATVTDQYGNLVNGAAVTFATDLGGVLTPRTTTHGIVTSQISSTLAGTAHITAKSGIAQNTAVVTFIPDAAYNVTLQADPMVLVADGASTSIITATVVDQYGNPIADGTLINFSAALGSVSTPHLTTDGRATAIFTAGILTGTAIVTATADGHSSSLGLTLIPTTVDLSNSAKVASANVITEAGQLTYTIMLTNSGNSIAVNVAMTDPIPLGTVFVPGSLNGGVIYDPDSNQIEWNGSVPANGSIKFSYAVTVTVIEYSLIVNSAFVSRDGLPERVLNAETWIIPSAPTMYQIYLPVIMRNSP